MLGYWATTVVGVHAIIAIGGVYVSCNWMVRGVQFPPPPPYYGYVATGLLS